MKNYISDLIPQKVYATWMSGKKIIINAPTGMGKTTFILEEFLPYCKMRGKRILVLCNRRLLARQYRFDLADRYMRYVEMEKDVAVWTYQEVAERVKKSDNIRQLFCDYDVIVWDEVHYFYSDADFNAFGTYVLLQAIALAGFYKTIIMVTATLDETLPLIKKTFLACQRKLESTEGHLPSFSSCCYDDCVFDFQHLADFDHFKCRYTQDVQTLAEILAKSDKKTLIFIDDKVRAERFRSMLIEIGGLNARDIFILNSQVLDEQSEDETITTLCGIGKILPKVLLTTSVLDNGVSVHDSEIGNLVIATESKVSFLQMIGRIRTENCEKCALFIYPRERKYYRRRLQQYEEKIKYFENLEKVPLETREQAILMDGWYGTDEYAEFLRNAIVLTKEEWEFYGDETTYVELKRGELLLAINDFAKEKTGNMVNAERCFYKLALDSPQRVAEKQIGWIGKSPDDLCVLDSLYLEKREAELIEVLLSVKNFTNTELQNKKMELGKAYRKDFFSEIVSKNGSFSTEKLTAICEKYGLKLIKKMENNRQIYSIERA